MNNKKILSQKEVAHQFALGTMNRGDMFVEHIKRTVKPVPWPTAKELHKAYPELTEWMKLVDFALGKVTEQFNIFFTDDEVNASSTLIYCSFVVSTRFCEDWSMVMCGGENCENKCEDIFEHLQIISPLMVASINSGSHINIRTTPDS